MTAPAKVIDMLERAKKVADEFSDLKDQLAQPLEQSPTRTHHSNMSQSQEVFDARLEAMEARMDARVASVEGKINTMLASMEGRDRALTASLQAMTERLEAKVVDQEKRFEGLAQEREKTLNAMLTGLQDTFKERDQRLTDLAASAEASANRAAGLKSTMWVTSLTTIVSILGIAVGAYFATQSSNLSIVQTTLSAFQAGQSSKSDAKAPADKASPAGKAAEAPASK